MHAIMILYLNRGPERCSIDARESWTNSSFSRPGLIFKPTPNPIHGQAVCGQIKVDIWSEMQRLKSPPGNHTCSIAGIELPIRFMKPKLHWTVQSVHIGALLVTHFYSSTVCACWPNHLNVKDNIQSFVLFACMTCVLIPYIKYQILGCMNMYYLNIFVPARLQYSMLVLRFLRIGNSQLQLTLNCIWQIANAYTCMRKNIWLTVSIRSMGKRFINGSSKLWNRLMLLYMKNSVHHLDWFPILYVHFSSLSKCLLDRCDSREMKFSHWWSAFFTTLRIAYTGRKNSSISSRFKITIHGNNIRLNMSLLVFRRTWIDW